MSVPKKLPLTLAEIEELEGILEFRQSLPHLYGFPWYKWAKEFFDYTGKSAFLVAANQVSKSSTQIRTIINWATEPKLWPKLWPGLLPGQKPNQFWYFYPTFDVWNNEFETKWEPDFLPRGELKSSPQYGWNVEYKQGFIKQINFNSGVTIYCKAYSQKIKDLQSGSCHMVALDEECPMEFMPEIQARLRATDGYMRAVFTATLGQEYWRRVMEPKNKDEEIYTGAWKRQVSLYDSQKYIDGKSSRWTDARIRQIINECGTDAEVQRRVFGRFVKAEGLKFESFDLDRNMTGASPPKVWGVYAGVDPGSGGRSGHPAAILFIAVRPDYREAVVFRAWRGDGIPTANPDILQKYRELKGTMLILSQVYDYKDKDFFLIAQGQGENFQPANKSRDEGFGLLNSLFKNGMLKVLRGDSELDKLVSEIQSLPAITDSRKKDTDDLCDAMRYACMAIPWDFSHLGEVVDTSKFADAPVDKRTSAQISYDERQEARKEFILGRRKGRSEIDEEFAEWNELSGADD